MCLLFQYYSIIINSVSQELKLTGTTPHWHWTGLDSEPSWKLGEEEEVDKINPIWQNICSSHWRIREKGFGYMDKGGVGKGSPHPHHGPSSLSILPVNGPSLTPHPSIHIEPSVCPSINQSGWQSHQHRLAMLSVDEEEGESGGGREQSVGGSGRQGQFQFEFPVSSNPSSVHPSVWWCCPAFVAWMALPGRLPHRCRCRVSDPSINQ